MFLRLNRKTTPKQTIEQETLTPLFRIKVKDLEEIDEKEDLGIMRLRIHNFVDGMLYFSVNHHNFTNFYAAKIFIEEKKYQILFKYNHNSIHIANFVGPWNHLNQTYFGLQKKILYLKLKKIKIIKLKNYKIIKI